jgi:hypothetical protein
MTTPAQVIELLHSIEDVRLDSQGEIEVKFKDPDPVWKDGWQANAGYVRGSFTQELLLLIEVALKGELPSAEFVSMEARVLSALQEGPLDQNELINSLGNPDEIEFALAVRSLLSDNKVRFTLAWKLESIKPIAQR